MTLATQQCSICLDAPPYDKCAGNDGCARLVTLGECDECGTPYVFDATDGGTICVPCVKHKFITLLEDARILKIPRVLPICERGEAVNLARNMQDVAYPRITQKGAEILADAVLRMDAYIRELK